MPYCDLHTHSHHSLDGELPPSLLVETAHASGVTHLAVTDHNCAAGNRDAVKTGKRLGMTIIPGIEIDCRHHDASLHLLGYFIDYEDKRYRLLTEDYRARKIQNNEKRIDAVRSLGFHLDTERLWQGNTTGALASVTIAEAVLTDPRNADSPELLSFRPGGEKSCNPLIEFCWTYMAIGTPAYVDDGDPAMHEAISLIASTGGLPVLAHPGSSIPRNEEDLPGILAAGVKGVEVYCGYHSPEVAAHWTALAKKHNALTTCGSDFHGRTKPSITLGGHGGDHVEVETTAALMKTVGMHYAV